jgi:hypothetical protein
MPVERFGGGRPPMFATVLSVLKSSMICPPGSVFVRCKLRVLLHALLHVATPLSRAQCPIIGNPLLFTPSIHYWDAEAELQHRERRILWAIISEMLVQLYPRVFIIDDVCSKSSMDHF